MNGKYCSSSNIYFLFFLFYFWKSRFLSFFFFHLPFVSFGGLSVSLSWLLSFGNTSFRKSLLSFFALSGNPFLPSSCFLISHHHSLWIFTMLSSHTPKIAQQGCWLWRETSLFLFVHYSTRVKKKGILSISSKKRYHWPSYWYHGKKERIKSKT